MSTVFDISVPRVNNDMRGIMLIPLCYKGVNLLHVTDYSDVANRNLDRVWHYEFPAGTEATDVEACQGYVAVSVDDLNNYADGKVYIFTAYDGDQMTLIHKVSSESVFI